MTTVPDFGNASVGRMPLLTVREAQALDAWLNSPGKADAAKSLALAENTVRTHIRRIRAKYSGLGYDVSTKGRLLERVIPDGLFRPARIRPRPQVKPARRSPCNRPTNGPRCRREAR